VWAFLLLSATLYNTSRTTPRISIPGTSTVIPTAAIPLLLIVATSFIVPHTSLLGHICGAAIGYGWGSGYLKFLAPPEKIIRWIEDKLKLKARLPSTYVSTDKQTGGKFGMSVLPSNSSSANGTV
jgi:glycosylphosphatidylinositol transamidase